jgi:hypothetical protein
LSGVLATRVLMGTAPIYVARHFIASVLEHQTDPQIARLSVVLNWFD